MRFIGNIRQGNRLISRASAMNREDDAAIDVGTRAATSMVRDMRRNNAFMEKAITPEAQAALANFDKLNARFIECIVKTMEHGKDAMVTIEVDGDDIKVFEGAHVAPERESETCMILHFEAESDERVAEKEQFLANLLSAKKE